MARGGSRRGAGRPQGAATERTREIANEAAKSGITPLEYMLKVMRSAEVDPDRRDKMAAAAAPYIHPKLANVEHTGKDGGPLQVSVVRFTDG